MIPDFLRHGPPAAVLRALPGARAVGGAVRDHLAGLPIHDVDVGVALPPEQSARLLADAGFRIFETGLQHGTITAVMDGVPIEVTSLRRDVATDGRHAEVVFIDDWLQDAARRDFTINAMSMGVDGEVHDHFGGREDLAAGRVRFVGDPAARLAEDFLRALRYFRFWARYGRGEPDADAIAAIRTAVPGLAKLSVERVWWEIKRLLGAQDPRDALSRMAGAGVLPAILPEAGAPARLDTLLAWDHEHGRDADPLLRVATLLPVGTDIAALAHRLRLSTDEARRLRELHDLRDLPDAGGLHAFQARVRARGSRTAAADLLFIAAAEDPDRDFRPLLARMDFAPGPAFPIQGRDALAAGLTPGPGIGALLNQTRDWWLAEGAVPSREDCLAKLRELAAT